MIANYYKSRI